MIPGSPAYRLTSLAALAAATSKPAAQAIAEQTAPHKAGIIAALGGSQQARDLAEGVEKMIFGALAGAAKQAFPAAEGAIDAAEPIVEGVAEQATENALANLLDGQKPREVGVQLDAGSIATKVAEALAPTLGGLGSALEKLVAKL